MLIGVEPPPARSESRRRSRVGLRMIFAVCFVAGVIVAALGFFLPNSGEKAQAKSAVSLVPGQGLLGETLATVGGLDISALRLDQAVGALAPPNDDAVAAVAQTELVHSFTPPVMAVAAKPVMVFAAPQSTLKTEATGTLGGLRF